MSRLWYINAHATSTPRGDAAETTAIHKLLHKQTSSSSFKPYLSSFKGSIGHLLGAAGSVEAIFALLCLRSGILAPNVNLERVGPDIQNELVRLVGPECDEQDRREEGKDLLLKNSFGFGGTNVSLLFKTFVP